jgi:purine-cytosine permease-like protein
VKKLGGARLSERLSRGGNAVDREIAAYHSERSSDLWLAVALHVVAISMAALQFALFLTLTGKSASALDIVSVFLVGAAIDVASFFVPARLGAQEATRMFATSIVGLGPETGLVFSLVLRVEQILWAGIGMLAYAVMLPSDSRPSGALPDDGVDTKTCA